MLSLRQTVLLVALSIMLITEMEWYYEQREKIEGLQEDMEIVGTGLRARETELERLGILGREAVEQCEKRKMSKRTYIRECREYANKYDTTTTTTGTNNKQEQMYLQELIRTGEEEVDACSSKKNGIERDYKDCVSRKSQKKDNSTENNFLLRTKSFLLFIGYARSGHSIVASLLDAHPHVVISHELHAVHRWAEFYSVDGTADRQGLFNEIMDNALSTTNKGYRSPNFTQKYYTLAVPGLYQGRYEKYIQVIGDKKGGGLVSLYKGTKEDFEELELFQEFVGYPLRIIHIVRNPYDNIATKFLYGISGETRKDAIREDIQIVSEDTSIDTYVRRHINAIQKIQRFIDYFGDRMLTLHHEDLIEDPIQFLTKLCNYLVIACSDYYLEKASEVVFSNPTKSRHSVEWSKETRDSIELAIQKYEFLRRYSYED